MGHWDVVQAIDRQIHTAVCCYTVARHAWERAGRPDYQVRYGAIEGCGLTLTGSYAEQWIRVDVITDDAKFVSDQFKDEPGITVENVTDAGFTLVVKPYDYSFGQGREGVGALATFGDFFLEFVHA